MSLLCYYTELFRCTLITLILSAEQIQAEKKSGLYGGLGNKCLRTSKNKASEVVCHCLQVRKVILKSQITISKYNRSTHVLVVLLSEMS